MRSLRATPRLIDSKRWLRNQIKNGTSGGLAGGIVPNFDPDDVGVRFSDFTPEGSLLTDCSIGPLRPPSIALGFSISAALAQAIAELARGHASSA